MRRLPFTNNRLSSTGFGQVKDDGLLWDFNPKLGNPNALGSTITVNDVDVSASAFYVADGSGSFTAKVGAAVSSIGTGTDPSNTLYHPFDSDCATLINRTGKAFSGATSVISTERVVILESIFRLDSRGFAVQNIIGADITPVTYASIYATATDVYARLHDGTDISDVRLTNSAIGWMHVVAFYDRTDNTRAIYVNGTQGTTVSGALPSAIGDLSSYTVGIGSRSDYGDNIDGAISQVAIYTSTSDCGGTTEWQAFADARFAEITGFKSSDGVPTTHTRASEKCLEIVGSDDVTRFVQVADNWVGCEKKNNGGSTYTCYRNEEAEASTVEFPTDCSQTSDWGFQNITSANKSTTIRGPVNDEFCNEIVSNTTNGTHWVDWDGGFGVAGHVMRVIVGPGDKDRFQLVTTFDGIHSASFSLTGNGSVLGQAGLTTSSGIKYLGTIDGVRWYECFVFYETLAFIPHEHRIQPITESGETYAGDGSTVDLYFAYASHEIRPSGYYTSPMINNTAGGTRSAETNIIPASSVPGDNNRMVTDCYIDDIDDVDALNYIYGITDATTNGFSLYLNTSGDSLSHNVRASGASQDTLSIAGYALDNGGRIKTTINDSGDIELEADGDSDTGSGITTPTNIARASIGAIPFAATSGTHVDIKRVKVFKK